MSGPVEQLPKTFGKYRLERKLATGGMAEIFLARPLRGSGDPLVIKRILPNLVQAKDFVSMFMDEARIAARLDHPNVVRVLDLGQVEGSYFLAMEYVHGEDIRRIYNQAFKLQRSLPLSHSIQVVADAGRGLAYAHKLTDFGQPMHVVHRDVSPQNILVTYDGRTKVVDFGIAKAVNKVVQTRGGVLKGKYSYMSPEQAMGEGIDHRTDIFALGIILYETTTGTRLFKRHNELATLQAVMKCDFVPPREALPGYPVELERIVLRALEKHPSDRWEDAEDFSDALETFLVTSGLKVSRSVISRFMHDLFADEAEADPLHPTPEHRSSSEVQAHPSEASPGQPSPRLPSFRQPQGSAPADGTGVPEAPSRARSRPPALSLVEPTFDDRSSVDLDRDTHPEQPVAPPPARPDAPPRSRSSGAEHPFVSVQNHGLDTPQDEAPTVANAPIFGASASASQSSPWSKMKQPTFGDSDSGTLDEDEDASEPELGPMSQAPPMGPMEASERTARSEDSDPQGPPHRAETQVSEMPRRAGLLPLALLGMGIGVAAVGVVYGLQAAWRPASPSQAPAGSETEATTGPGIEGTSNPRSAGPRPQNRPDNRPKSPPTRSAPAPTPAAPGPGPGPDPGSAAPSEAPARSRYGFLQLRVDPWAQVYIDGRNAGLTPVPRQELPPGEHRIRLENPDLKLKWTGTIRIEAGLEQSVRVDLEAVGQPL